ncbi:MAG: cytochrome c(L), periplasmic [Hyphomicrobium zavarzinii]|jgi:cytochrome c-L|uniref:cytochrome c(L), periplasmic n=1 Tax=Hyphomicrobium TaxID=81 RepID=UPI000360B84D|nr:MULTISPECIES: cytochrome c(L), periplasmic [Hyphomicrobium]MBL8845484.1 cytochrome c(L), periplasmic [Hyphomicrobium zavarzinii]WBT37195.1 cytochrome c(L), periplasmic [Hyphomicrobium sp. DMF-1]HML44675.1 cytochrome c(L), periplasmic [Hyphomicrobium zavarzinii]
MTRKSKAIFASVLLAAGAFGGAVAWAEDFRHTITGEDLKVPETANPEGRDTEAVKKFLESGVNLYTEVKACLPKGEEVYLTSCSGCHGHVAEGKVGPGLNDAYWTYPKNKTDKGLFETIYGGAQGMMGPHNDLQLDEMLKLIAWIRHLYTGDIQEADWLTEEQKKAFTPYKLEEHASADDSAKAADAGECKVSAN